MEKQSYEELEKENCYLRQEIRGLKKENAKLQEYIPQKDFIKIKMEGDICHICVYDGENKQYVRFISIYSDYYDSSLIDEVYTKILDKLSKYDENRE